MYDCSKDLCDQLMSVFPLHDLPFLLNICQNTSVLCVQNFTSWEPYIWQNQVCLIFQTVLIQFKNTFLIKLFQGSVFILPLDLVYPKSTFLIRILPVERWKAQ